MPKDKTQYRFLVVEDNAGDFMIVEEFLEEQFFMPVLVRAENYREAAAILADDLNFSAVLLDLSLPDKRGRELVTKVLGISSLCCPVIILTGYADIEFSIDSISLGIMDYLLKDDLTGTSLYKSITYSIERKKNIAALSESQKQYSDLFNLSPQPMWLFDSSSYRFVRVNKAALALYGYTEEEFLNMTLMDIKLGEDIEKAKANISNPAGDDIFKGLIKHRKKSGEIIEVDVYSTPITIGGRSFRSVLAIDATEKNLNEHKITKAIIKTQEDERYEIGGELHDNVCQILAASQMSFGMLAKSIPEERAPVFMQAMDYIKLALDEIRKLSHRLAPAFFNDSTLEEAFKRLFHNFNLEGNFESAVNFDNKVKDLSLSLEMQLNLYRILQEQLRNILKYAKASLIEVNVSADNHLLKMTVSDNGIGFNIDKVKNGIGLSNMKRRTELFSGKFVIQTAPGKGCLVSIELPV